MGVSHGQSAKSRKEDLKPQKFGFIGKCSDFHGYR